MKFLNKFKPEHYWSVLLSLVFLLVVATLMEEHPVLYMLFALSLIWILGSIISTLWKFLVSRTLALISAGLVLVSAVVWVVPGIGAPATRIGIIICLLAYATFVFITTIAMLRDVFGTRRVTTDTIVGSICIYLLMGMFFAFIYAALDIFNPEHFNFGIMAAPTINEFRDYLYFSYTTITTLGYGDMLPQMPISRLLTSLEAIIGPVYLAILVARLVGMHISQSLKGNAD